MVLTLIGAGLLWFGWFGFNGGSALNGTALAGSAFAATQAAAAAAGLGWMLVEWIHKGKPTALGLASGIVAGLVAVTPASGFVYMWGGVCHRPGRRRRLLPRGRAQERSSATTTRWTPSASTASAGSSGRCSPACSAPPLVQSASADGPFAYKAHRAQLESLKKDDGKPIKEAKDAADKADAEAKAKEKAVSTQIEALTKAKDEAEKKFDDAAGSASATPRRRR